MTHIAFPVQRLGPIRGEGPFQKVIRWLTPALSRRGVLVDVVVTAPFQRHSWMDEVHGVRVFGFGARRVRYALPAYRRYLARERPVVCLPLVPGGSIFNLVAAAGLRRPPAVLPWEPTLFKADLPYLPWRMRITYPTLMRLTYPRATGILGVSQDCISELRGLGVDLRCLPQAVVPNPVNQEEIMAAVRQGTGPTEWPPWRFVIVAAGRLIRQKGHDVLVSAIAALRRRGLDVGALILGEGPDRTALESLARRQRVADRISLPGYLEAPHAMYSRASVFVHPSRWEGFGMSLLEAMAAGAPVVATSCPGGPKEILQGGRHGILVPPDNPEALAVALEELLRDGQLLREWARRAANRAAAYAPDTVATALVDAIRATSHRLSTAFPS